MISSRHKIAVCATLAALVAGVVNPAYAIEFNERRLNPRLEGDMLHVSAPNFRFLNGKPLERLKNGASIAFVAQLTVSSSPTYVVPDARTAARFAISYDIWQERFSVTKITDHADQKRTVSHLDGPAAEAWCFDNLTINRSELPSGKPFYLQLDLRVEDPRDQTGLVSETGISLVTALVDIFSRPVREKQAHWLLDSGPLRLEDIRRGVRW